MSTAADAPGSPELDSVRGRARELAESVEEDVLAREPLEVTLERLVIQGAPQPLVLDVSDRYYESRGNSFTISYPFVGPTDPILRRSTLFRTGGSHGSQSYVTARFDVHEQATDPDRFEEELADLLNRCDEQILHDVQVANEDLTRQQEAFTLAARKVLTPRWRMVRTVRGAMERLDIPLGPRTNPLVHIPVRPTQLSQTVIEQAAEAGAPQYALADDLAESVISTIASFGLALERLPVTAAKLVGEHEESLRDVLLFVLNANFQGQVTGETFISKGKADLLLRWKDRDAFVGECKIWKGPKALSEGLDQLLDRYTLWRQTRIALVVFIRAPRDATAIIEHARQVIVDHPRVRRELDTTEPAHRSDYEVLGSGDEKRLVRLTLLPVVIS